MAKKFDSEALKKNGFWIGLGAFVLIWLIALVVVITSADASAREKWKSAKAAIDKERGGRPKTPAYLKPWESYGSQYKAHKDEVWKQAWKQQELMYTWPEGMTKQGRLWRPEYPEDLWGDDTNEGLNNRGRFREQYKTQFAGLEKYLEPVQLAGGLYAIVPPQQWSSSRAPTREEIWLAQENFWVRRELLYAVREAVNAVAYFKPVPTPADEGEDKEKDKEKDKAKPAVRRVFRNPNWELDLRFEKSNDTGRLVLAPSSTIKNINATHRTQPLANPRNKGGLGFRLRQGQASYLLNVSGEPLAFGKSAPLKPENPDISPVNPQQAFDVEQVLEWELSPVRRVEGIFLPHHSHRTITWGLKVRPDLKAMDPPPPAPEGEAATAGGMGGMGEMGGTGAMGGAPTPMGSGMGGPPGMAGGMGPGGGGVPADATPINNIDRARYMHVKEQARHLPLAIRIVAEQAHIHDVLAALANSRLRMQITQLQLHHVHNVRQGDSPGTGEGGTPGMGGGLGPRPGPGMLGPRPGPGMLGPRPGPGSGSGSGSRPGPAMLGPRPGSGGSSSGSGPGPGSMGPSGMGPMGEGGEGTSITTSLQDAAQLVEMTVYGVATLYERFPPRKKPETPADAAMPAPTGN